MLVFFSSSGNVSFQTNLSFWLVETHFLANGNQFFSGKAFPLSKLIFQQILHSGQWRLILWLMETISCQYLKYPFHWKRFFHLLEIYFKRILYYSQWQLVETIFFHSHFSWKPLLQLEGGQSF